MGVRPRPLANFVVKIAEPRFVVSQTNGTLPDKQGAWVGSAILTTKTRRARRSEGAVPPPVVGVARQTDATRSQQ